MSRSHYRLRWLAIVAVLSLIAIACSDDGDDTSADTDMDPAPTEGDAGEVAEDPAATEPATDAGGPVTFFSTQLAPVEEAEKVRNEILAGFDDEVDFVGADNYGAWVDRITAEAEARRHHHRPAGWFAR